MPVIIDGNKEIITPVRDILVALQETLYVKHIDKLKDINFSSGEAQITCPHHKGGKENKPSCGVMLEDSGKYPAGTAHCFVCDYRANLVKLVADCLGVSYKSATEWILGVSTFTLIESRRNLDLDIFNESKEDCVYSSFVTCDELKEYDFFHPYMKSRHLSDDIIMKYDIGYDRKTNSITFPVYVDGKCIFVARRTVYGKRFIMPKIEPKPIYGLDYIDNANEIFVTESVINALTLCSWGYCAVALFGTGSSYQIKQLNKLNVRKIVLCLDGDDAGDKGITRISNGLSNKIVVYKQMPRDGRDINDMTKEEFDELPELF